MNLHPALFLSATVAICTAAPTSFVGVRPDLISEAKTIVPGQTFTVALSLKHAKTYHTYWVNPGTVGFATSLQWELPEGFTAGEIQWQVPERCKMVIYNAHGYNHDTLLLVDITAPDPLPKEPIILKAKGAWMACGPKRCCNLGFKEFTLQLPGGKNTEWDESVRKQISDARLRLPRPISGWEYSCKRNGNQFVLKIRNSAGHPLIAADEIYFYSHFNHINTLEKQKLRIDGSEITITLPIGDYAPTNIGKLAGLLYHPAGWPGADGQKYMPVDLMLR
ncbi:MAG: hypothetical protein CMN05_11745 [Roseibacillus sp.]|mgnify:CR=1 FL=1|jgi:thiol:disulfide interchange protein DsbD|nr:hypothetical protein [Roseibacillus sp.]MBP34365.1 hypothetical protein [Roseibacillus sp.]MCP4729065.1 hypothetical protein [Roseibacillus sp.]MDP7307356.1 protein-disulfide reductase DsbD family protein [Roseibacillus sp.]MDP7655537.1 protein-disulfide reductase DsbD family protein [Roseibacillus sp.]|tara:strand:+ start:21437 stop:22270 length:834 start_codon:yes stop_codon:yes gene_type:complete